MSLAGDIQRAFDKDAATITELQERCADAQRLAFQWMERHDKVVGFIRENYPSVMMPNLPFPSPVSRPDASAGLVEAAEWHQQQVDNLRQQREAATFPAYYGQDIAMHTECARVMRELASTRAANRSEK